MALSWLRRLLKRKSGPVSRAGRKKPGHARFIPAVEPLAERILPAVTATFLPGASTLSIFGDAAQGVRPRRPSPRCPAAGRGEEARHVSQLEHPSIVPIYDLGELPDGRPFFVMKLIHGRTLAELLAARATPAEDLPRWVGVFAQVCVAVAFAHARELIHRDLKPSNVMLGEFGEVLVLDWGIAKALAARPQPAPVPPTPVLLSPAVGTAATASGAAPTRPPTAPSRCPA